MTTSWDEKRAQYQLSLRTIGRYLDERPALDLNVLEVPDGFVVRYQRSRDDVESSVVRLTWEQIRDQNTVFQQRRGKRDGRKLRNPTANKDADSEDVRYEDFLRALGYELDQANAWDIALDQQNDNAVVTYLQLEPRVGFAAKKKVVYLASTARNVILKDAHERRSLKPEQRAWGRRLFSK